MTWLIAYDIACPRRWRRLYRLVRDHGVRVQWSVFVVVDDSFQPTSFLTAASRIIDRRQDDLRLYRLSGKVTGAPAGAALVSLPAGIYWRPPLIRRARPRRTPLDRLEEPTD